MGPIGSNDFFVARPVVFGGFDPHIISVIESPDWAVIDPGKLVLLAFLAI